MNSNGLRLATDEDFCRALADLGVYVMLSFDTFQPERALRIHGRDVIAQKQQALENLQRFGIGTTLLNVMIRGLNEDEIGEVIRLAKAHSVVRSVTVQTMTFTGKGGGDFQPRETMPLDGAAKAIEARHERRNAEQRFLSPLRGASALLQRRLLSQGRGTLPLADRLLQRGGTAGDVGAGLSSAAGEDGQEVFRQAIDRLWAEGDPANLLPAVRGLVDRMYPPGRALEQQPSARPRRRRACWPSICIRTWTRTRWTWPGWPCARTRCPTRKAG